MDVYVEEEEEEDVEVGVEVDDLEVLRGGAESGRATRPRGMQSSSRRRGRRREGESVTEKARKMRRCGGG